MIFTDVFRRIKKSLMDKIIRQKLWLIQQIKFVKNFIMSMLIKFYKNLI